MARARSKIVDQCDFLFVATPHGVSSSFMPEIFETGLKTIDVSDIKVTFRRRMPVIPGEILG